MPNLLPIVFIVLASLALLLTLLWLWQSLRHAFVHALAGPTASGVVSPERAALLQEKQNLLLALKDLENERDSGKLSSDDYRELNDQYRKRAREVLRQLDGMLSPHRARARSLLDGAPAMTVAAASFEKPQPLATVTAANSCQSCGTGNDADAVFCKKCGARVRSEAVV
jgi:hypothetical protein